MNYIHEVKKKNEELVQVLSNVAPISIEDQGYRKFECSVINDGSVKIGNAYYDEKNFTMLIEWGMKCLGIAKKGDKK